MGPQGSGKGTQAELLKQRANYFHLSVGELLRKEVELNTALGKEIKQTLDMGLLVSNKITNTLVLNLVNNKNKQNIPVILDGYPRNEEQALFVKQNIPITRVFLLELDDELSIKRVSSRYYCPKCKRNYNMIYEPLKPKKDHLCDICGVELVQRTDDTPEAIKKRLQIYHKLTEKIIPLFKSKLIKINADQDIEKIYSEIKQYL